VQVLLGARVPFGVVTLSPTGAEEAEALGIPVLRGDAARARTLQLAGVERAKALVVPDDEPGMAHRVVAVARSLNPTMHVAVRTRRRAEVAELVAAGADEVVAEELEGVVQLFRDVLRHYSIGADEILRHEDALRRDGYAALAAAQAGRPPVLDCTLGEDCLDRRRVRLRAGAPAVGRTLGALALDAGHGLEPLALFRDGAELRARGELELAVGDELELRGAARAFASAAALFRTPVDDMGDDAADAVKPAPTAAAVIDAAARRVSFDTRTALALAVDPRTSRCAHVADLRPVVPQTPGCAECLAAGRDDWVHLRLCMTCGHVGCCDDSPGRHATGHWQTSRHAVMRSLEPGERWGWCFADGLEP
jgi:CPA2 family monovalent cation:H+ antiporter-2